MRPVISEKREKEVIHILRSPYGFSDGEVRSAGLVAATMVENYKAAYINMRQFAEENGLNTVATNR